MRRHSGMTTRSALSGIARQALAVGACLLCSCASDPGTHAGADGKPTNTAMRPWPAMEKLPLKVDARSMQGLQQMSSAGVSEEDVRAFQGYFQPRGDFPVAMVTYMPETKGMDHKTSMTGFADVAITWKMDNTSRASMQVSDWTDPASVLFRQDAQARVVQVYTTTGTNTSQTTRMIYGHFATSFRNTMVDLLGRLNAQRPRLRAIKDRYVAWRADARSKDRQLQEAIAQLKDRGASERQSDQETIRHIEKLIREIEQEDPDHPQLPVLKKRLEELKKQP